MNQLFAEVGIPFLEWSVAAGGAVVALNQVWLWRQRRSDIMRETYEVGAGNISYEKSLAFWRSTSGLPKPGPLDPAQATCFERYADFSGEHFYLTTPGSDFYDTVDELALHQLGVELERVERPKDPIRNSRWKAVELSLRGFSEPLRIGTPEGVAATFGVPFANIPQGHAVVMQIVMFPDHPRKPTKDDREKVTENTFNAIVRLGAAGEHADALLRNLLKPFRSIESHGAKFATRHIRQASGRLSRRAGTWGFSCLFNAKELACITFLLNDMRQHWSRRIPPTLMHDEPGEGKIPIGTSNSPKHKRGIAISANNLMLHTWVTAPTGAGKSVLLENMAVGIMNAGMGLVVIEGKGDLAENIINDVPYHRRDDAICLDARDRGRPIGLNILRGDNPSRITGHVVSMFKMLSGDSWGHQMQRVLRNAVYTACLINAEATTEDDIQTLYDVKQLLVNREYRAAQIRKINRQQHPDVIQEWRWLDEKHELVLDAPVTRLDAFLGDPVIRNIVGQRGGLDMDEVVRGKILVVPLPGGLLGEENANALGMLIWEMVWDAHLRRPPEERTPNILMADEYQLYAGESLSKADPFALARSYGLGLCVANQFSSQLPRAVFETVSRNAQNIMVFAASHDEAVKMKDHFGPLTAEDLQYLPQYTVAARVMGSGGRAPTVTLKTPPPPRPTGTAAYIINRSRTLYGRPVEEVQADLLSRHKAGEPKRRPKIGEMVE